MAINVSPYSNQYYPLPFSLNPAAQVVNRRPIDFSAILASTDDSLFSSSPVDSGFQDVLALSPQAQDLLTQDVTGGTDILGSGLFATLTEAQLQQVISILAAFKDAPATQESFNAIQDQLRTAGLAPDQLALQERAREFDPASVLLDALTDADTGLASGLNSTLPGFSEEVLQTDVQGYIQQIFLLWQSLRGNVIGNVPLVAA